MKESKAYQEILEEGREEGQENARRMDLLDVVEVRFGRRGVKSFKPVVESVHNPAQLRALLKLAAKCSDLDQLMAAAK